MTTGFNRAEAGRWLSAAEKLLSTRDFHGARTFAIRARENDPSFEASNQVLAVADTIIAGESVIVTVNGNQYHDWYTILQLPRFTQSIDVIATQYRKLSVLLSPERNRFPFADRSYKLVYDAWSVLSNVTRKIMYDTELQLSHLGERPGQTPVPQQQPPPPPPQPPVDIAPVQRSPRPPSRKIPPPPVRRNPHRRVQERSNKVTVEEEGSNLDNVTKLMRQNRPIQAEPTRETRPSQTESTRPSETETEKASFWTACPYCYFLYEFPKVYEDCTLRCENCQRAFHAVIIASPPVTENDSYFCCWGFFPVGYSGKMVGNNSKWTPVSPMFPCPNQDNAKYERAPPVYYDEVIVSDSDSDKESDDEWEKESDDGWGSNRKKKKTTNVKGKGNDTRKNVRRPQAQGVKKGNQNQNQIQNVSENVEGMEGTSSGGGRVLRSSGKKQMGNGLDLNVEFSNELEELAPTAPPRMNQENGEEDDGIFFEGLDEFLSSLPILNVVKDDKVKPTQ